MIKRVKILRITLIIIVALLLIISLVISLIRKSTSKSQLVSQTELYIPITGLTIATEAELLNTMITLPDGSMIILRPDTKIKILNQPDIPSDLDQISVILVQGEMMAIPNLGLGNWFNVQSSTGYTARIQGCAMVVNFDGLLSFEMTCIAGNCEIGSDNDSLISATTNFTWVYQVGILVDPVAIDYAELQKDYRENLPVCVVNAETQPFPQMSSATPTPTFTPTATATPTPSATMTRKPSTTPLFDLAATATEACRLFEEEFPSTPCP